METYAGSLRTWRSVRARLAWFALHESRGETVCSEWEYLGPFQFGLSVFIVIGELGHPQCDLSVTLVQHKPPPQCSRFSDHGSLCVCSGLIFRPWPLLPSERLCSAAAAVKTALPASTLATCYTCIVGNISCSFPSFPRSCFGCSPYAPAVWGHWPGCWGSPAVQG